ncbi:GST-like protein [Palleronia marisminoris]|uniref:Disulfide-bond oxidoreductase YghU n=1 Tax=Palleronia marisminoris TaxID=315423 RepID=A0A1Y5SSU1_9RHOB|nr:glutathione-dependent disulfide-bond oxidoreductase [Palleronia marisminoris]SFG96923.1 GST-like protein [Palleronia marisminoris]SLN47499.1 Disulfide-bond oxidoreductase YghU [Palleronia marisminoris]
MSDYTPPKVWTWETESGGKWASLNRPVAGPIHDKDLPKGDHPYQLYSMGTPNGQKVTILFEELLEAGHPADYDAWMIDISEGDQFGSGFVAVNPNSKIPALMDYTGDTPVRIFESAAILMHLAERHDAFLGSNRAEMLSWLFWLQGSAPYLGGGFGHFYAYAPEPMEYPINRFAMEAKRQLDVLNRHLADRRFLAGEDYTIADIATFPWYGRMVFGKAYEAGEFLGVHEYEHVIRWANEIDARPAVQRGQRVNRKGEGLLRERHAASDFDAL